MKTTTMYEFVRMCNTIQICSNCPLCKRTNGTDLKCNEFIKAHVDKANNIILNWWDKYLNEINENKKYDDIRYIIVEYDFDNKVYISHRVDNKIFKTRDEANTYRLTKLNHINMAIQKIHLNKEDE